MMYNNFKAVFQIFIFTFIRAIEHNIQLQSDFKMSTSKVWLGVHNWIFPQVNILFSFIKQHIINDVQQFLINFFKLKFLHVLELWNSIDSKSQTLKCPYLKFGYVYIIEFFHKWISHLVLLNNK